MTVAVGSIVNSFIGNGSANNFSFSFPVFAQGDITVTVTLTATGVVTTLILGTDYTVLGLNPAGSPPTTGSITLVNSSQAWLTVGNLSTGYSLQISRVMQIAQATSIRNQGPYYPETIEAALDYLTMLIQQLNQAINAPVLPKSLTSVTGDITINTNGAGLVVTTPDGTKTFRIYVNNNGILSTLELT
jgi:hypothetical protein